MSDLENRLRAALQDETAELAARPDLADDMVSHGMSVRRRRRAAGGIAGLVVLAAAFPVWKSIDTSSSPFEPVSSTTATQPPPTHPSPSTPTTPTVITPTWSTAALDVTHQPNQVPLVTGLRVGEHQTYDRVVIDLDGPMTSYHVEYVSHFVADGSGARIPVVGRAFLAIRLIGADAHSATGQLFLRPLERHRYSYPTLRGTVVTGDFEGNVSFGLGLNTKARFTVSELTGPNRLVIDVHH